jgi:integrase/recombinase XerD
MAINPRKRSMRFAVMEEVARKGSKENPVRMNLDITQKEKEVLDIVMAQAAENKRNGMPLDFNIPRAQMELVSKFITPFQKMADIFLKVQKGRGNSEITIKHYEQSIRKLCKFFCWLNQEEDIYETLTDANRVAYGGAQPYAVFERDDFEAHFRDFLTEAEGVSEITVATYFRDYRAIAYWMMDEGLIKKRTIVIRNVEADIKDCYTDAEIEKLLKKPKYECSFAEYRSWVVINWVLATGNRISTICKIKIDDVDFEENMININIQKNKKKARIPLQTKLRKILLDYIDEWLTADDGTYISEYLFPSSYEDYNNYPISREQMYKTVAAYNKSRGVFKTSFHLFRHTFAKNWIISGGDLHSLQRVLGHSTLAMVVKYANLYGEDLKPKVEDFSVLSTHNTNAKPRGRMIQRRGRR